jgi:hypothetical protein
MCRKGVEEMDLIQALFSSINEVWSNQELDINGEMDCVLTTVYIHKSLAKAIEDSGFEVPDCFDPNIFNFNEDGNYFEITIEVADQDGLIYYHYE